MSYTPVPAGGIEPPRHGSTTRCLPTWPSRQDLVAEAGIEPAADEAYETSALPTELFRGVGIERTHRSSMLHAHVQMAAPLGFEPGPPSSKPGALPARRRGNTIGATCGIRTRATRFEGPGSSAARRTWRYGADGENRTRVFCLEGSGSAIELRPRGGWCRDRTCATRRSRRASNALPCRSANHPALAPSG